MNRDLTESSIDRQNILNNSLALKEVQRIYGLSGVPFNDTIYFTNSQIAEFFSVDIRTIERLVEEHKDELESNDYHVISGKMLTEFRQSIKDNFVTDIDVGSKTRKLAVSTFRTVLNFAMLLKNSTKAQEIRSTVLDIVIDVIAKKTGGSTKYINQRDSNYLTQAFVEESERKKFTNALNEYIDMSQYKYAYFTNKVYEAVFKENSKEYRNILALSRKDKTRDTMYSEVLLVIASFEAGLAFEFQKESEKIGRKLTRREADTIIHEFAQHPAQQPLIHDARTKMASRDFGLRDAHHDRLDEYLKPVSPEEYEKFLGEKSKSLQQQIIEHREVFERLKDR
ncbi:DNA-binding protein [Enterococcus diestrammenae]|uniref:DNA-binding protein n=1 Tax=Enterococcus diestrammenae TaxID=1155073 RepID=A0ABV0F2U0_9ENTE|nr:DNA-binding protein [Enterococcus diestrammenae]KAF1294774.1 DNA-binding protein [Enterococcus diestrammenae]